MSELKCNCEADCTHGSQAQSFGLRARARRILIIALLAIALVFTGSAPQSPYIMGDANPNREMLGPWPCPQTSPGVCATPQQIADEPDGTEP